MRIVALTILGLALVALFTEQLDSFFPSSKKASVTSNVGETLHSKLRAAAVIIAACAVVAASIAAYVYLE